MVKSQRHIREWLAEIEHEQWVHWAKNILPELQGLTRHHLPYGREVEAGNCGCEICQRIKRWERLFIPYSDLTEEQKDQDRVWADKSLSYLHSQGVVIQVERELPIDALGGDEELNKIAQKLYNALRIDRLQDGDLVIFAMFLRSLFESAGYVVVEPLITTFSKEIIC